MAKYHKENPEMNKPKENGLKNGDAGIKYTIAKRSCPNCKYFTKTLDDLRLLSSFKEICEGTSSIFKEHGCSNTLCLKCSSGNNFIYFEPKDPPEIHSCKTCGKSFNYDSSHEIWDCRDIGHCPLIQNTMKYEIDDGCEGWIPKYRTCEGCAKNFWGKSHVDKAAWNNNEEYGNKIEENRCDCCYDFEEINDIRAYYIPKPKEPQMADRCCPKCEYSTIRTEAELKQSKKKWHKDIIWDRVIWGKRTLDCDKICEDCNAANGLLHFKPIQPKPTEKPIQKDQSCSICYHMSKNDPQNNTWYCRYNGTIKGGHGPIKSVDSNNDCDGFSKIQKEERCPFLLAGRCYNPEALSFKKTCRGKIIPSIKDGCMAIALFKEKHPEWPLQPYKRINGKNPQMTCSNCSCSDLMNHANRGLDCNNFSCGSSPLTDEITDKDGKIRVWNSDKDCYELQDESIIVESNGHYKTPDGIIHDHKCVHCAMFCENNVKNQHQCPSIIDKKYKECGLEYTYYISNEKEWFIHPCTNEIWIKNDEGLFERKVNGNACDYCAKSSIHNQTGEFCEDMGCINSSHWQYYRDAQQPIKSKIVEIEDITEQQDEIEEDSNIAQKTADAIIEAIMIAWTPLIEALTTAINPLIAQLNKFLEENDFFKPTNTNQSEEIMKKNTKEIVCPYCGNMTPIAEDSLYCSYCRENIKEPSELDPYVKIVDEVDAKIKETEDRIKKEIEDESKKIKNIINTFFKKKKWYHKFAMAKSPALNKWKNDGNKIYLNKTYIIDIHCGITKNRWTKQSSEDFYKYVKALNK